MGKKEWFESWFNTKDYHDLYKHRNKQDAGRVVKLFFRNIRLAKSAKVLDLACGKGRHSVLFAEKGFNTLGIDLSPRMIKQARKDYKKKYDGALKFEIGDMRKIAHKNEFDLVVNLFSSFGYFEKAGENEKVIKSVSRSLKKGGYFYFDFFNSGYLKKNLKPISFEKRSKESVIQLRYIKNGMSIKTILIFKDDPGSKNSFRRFDENVRLFDAADLIKMFKNNGLKILKKFGDYSGKPFRKSESERLIILAQKV